MLAPAGVLAALWVGCAGDEPESSAAVDPVGFSQADSGNTGAGASKALVDAATPAPSDAAAVLAPSSAGPRCGVLRARLRDFKREHPDFEHVVNGRVVTGIVSPTLGADHKPVVEPNVAQANGVLRFEDWYVDKPGVNQAFEQEIPLSPAGNGRFVFDSNAFFPLDGLGFGEESLGHNFHFTTEIHTRFTVHSGDQFTFAGDDDLWLFINGHLAIDLGGVHNRSEGTVNLDQRAAELGIQPGGTYPMDIFHAERHTSSSNFRIETSIECLQSVELL